MDYNKTILIVTVAVIGIYGLYLGKIEVVTGCLGIAGAILTPGKETASNEKTSDVPTANPAG